MKRNKMSAMAVIAVILGAVGAGVGAFAAWIILTGGVDGDDGDDGDDGFIVTKEDHGQDAPIVKIIQPYDGQNLWGNITIDAFIWEEDQYNIKVMVNGSEEGTALQFVWDTAGYNDGWRNITVLISDVYGNSGQDTVIVYVDNSTNSGVRKTWYNQLINQVYTNPADTDIVIGALTINFNVRAGESVYFHYTCISIFIFNGWSNIEFYFYIDGSKLLNPLVYIGCESPGGFNIIVIPVALQYVSSSISPGSHSATIVIKGSQMVNGIDEQTLLVQTLIP